ncbi:hypothetical protein M758_1G188300 [Ceratodon purpureus]|nr:hypothetical protein M758_1G188300 [Ceratodon purpureus]
MRLLAVRGLGALQLATLRCELARRCRSSPRYTPRYFKGYIPRVGIPTRAIFYGDSVRSPAFTVQDCGIDARVRREVRVGIDIVLKSPLGSMSTATRRIRMLCQFSSADSAIGIHTLMNLKLT